MSDPVYIGEESGRDAEEDTAYIRATSIGVFRDAEKPAEAVEGSVGASVNASDEKEWLVEPRTRWAGLRGVSDLEWITVKQFEAYAARQADFEKRRRELYEGLLNDGPA